MSTAVFLLGPMVGLSGGDMHALRLVDDLARSGEDVALVAPASMGENLPEHSRGSVRSVRTPLDDRVLPMPLYTLTVSARTVLGALAARRPAVAVAGSHFFHDVLPCVWLHRRHGTQVVAYVYHLVEEERTGPRSLRTRVSIAFEKVSLAALRGARPLLFVDNHATAAALTERGFADVVLTQNAYDPWESLPDVAHAARPTLVTIGRLTEEKGIWDALEVARRLPDTDLVVLGDGPLRASVQARVEADGLQHVHLRGFVTEAEKWRALRSAHAFLAPSREEGWGIAVGEALTAALPVAAYDLPAYAHFGERFPRVPIGDVDALAAAARDALAGPAADAAGLPRWADTLRSEREAIAARSTRLGAMQEEIAVEPSRRRRIWLAIRREGPAQAADKLVRWVGGYALSYVRQPSDAVTYRGREYPVHVSRTGRTWMTERGVELPIFVAALREAPPDARVLEIGRVLNGYFEGLTHTVVDKYDEHSEVIREDIMEFEPAEPFDLIVAVSTLEHVGWDETPRTPDKALRTIERVRTLLKPGGRFLFDWPIGYHPELDRAADDGRLPVQGCLRRIGRGNHWVECEWPQARDTPYDYMIWRGNAVAFCELAAAGEDDRL